MDILFNKKFLKHNVDSEAEGAYRIADFGDLPDIEADGETYMELVHGKEYIDRIKQACKNDEYLAEVSQNTDSWEAAKTAVGLSVLAAENNSFAAIRPPGHHAGVEKAHGFCLFNNLAIATQKLVNDGKRVFVFDIDGHHGDGTQNIFYERSDVFYCSVHQNYAFPYTGFAIETGAGEGVGYTANFPIYEGKGDKAFLEIVDKAIILARQFQADVIAVSAGFDSYADDRLLGLNFTIRGYYECAFRLRRAFPDIFAVLEGGYHLDIRKCVDSFVEGIHKGAIPPKQQWDDDMSIG
ncbi:MAG: histone deacetylase family protein [Bacteroidetes bacterium]|nr:histone deacetylase family protein [Bacteroidota bacterium]